MGFLLNALKVQYAIILVGYTQRLTKLSTDSEGITGLKFRFFHESRGNVFFQGGLLGPSPVTVGEGQGTP